MIAMAMIIGGVNHHHLFSHSNLSTSLRYALAIGLLETLSSTKERSFRFASVTTNLVVGAENSIHAWRLDASGSVDGHSLSADELTFRSRTAGIVLCLRIDTIISSLHV